MTPEQEMIERLDRHGVCVGWGTHEVCAQAAAMIARLVERAEQAERERDAARSELARR